MVTSSTPAVPVENLFKHLSIYGCEFLSDPKYNENVFQVTSPHALTQAAGYAKYKSGLKQSHIFFRGQTKLYGNLSPTLLRGVTSQRAQSNRLAAIRKVCLDVVKHNKIFKKIPPDIHEGLLQHYGLKTTWVDLVDNVWIALWFACYKAFSAGQRREFLHFEIRNPDIDEHPFAYILLIATDAEKSQPSIPGLFTGKKTEVIDLRIASPSIFLRPHAQHGVLFRARGIEGGRDTNYSSQISGIIRIHLRDALNWLGYGSLTGTQVLFPSAFHDKGYAILLQSHHQFEAHVGAIHHIGA